MWVWILVALAGLLAVFLLLLSLPLDIALRIEVYKEVRLYLIVSWLFGLVSRRIELKRRVRPPAIGPELKKPRRRWRLPPREMRSVRLWKRLIKEAARLVSGITRRIHLNELVINFKFSLGDPADTGTLFALIGPATPFLAGPNRHISLQPYLDDRPALEGYSYGSARLTPIGLAVPVMRFVFAPAVLQAGFAMARQRWKRKS